MTATMATIKDKYVDEATNNNKEYVDNVKPLYLVPRFSNGHYATLSSVLYSE